MKRSEINRALRTLEATCVREHCYLPPFCHFTPEEWNCVSHEYDDVRDCMLGWDITDYGLGDFDKVGMALVTIRNGCRALPEKYPKVYAEKLLYMKEGQYSPNHFHWYKTEDIINRGGGNLVIELYHADPAKNGLCGGTFPISVNGMRRTLDTGDRIVLTPGDSVALEPIHAHRFYGEPGKGTILVGEVSSVNDDTTDNCFIDKIARFDEIEEDESPKYLLANEIEKFILP